MTNPFEDEDGTYVVLRNAECQYSLWPKTVKIPAGWESCFGLQSRQECLDYIEKNWTDMRPLGLIKVTEEF
jgi:MbtH protein